jgi:hypothetical protein
VSRPLSAPVTHWTRVQLNPRGACSVAISCALRTPGGCEGTARCLVTVSPPQAGARQQLQPWFG